MEHLAIPTIADLLVRNAEEVGDRTFLVIGDHRVDYATMRERARATARSLVALGVGPGDHVGLLMPNSLEFLDVVFAAAWLGAVAVPINSRFRRAELRHVVPDANLRVVVCNDAAAERADHLDRLVDAFPAIAEHDADDPGPLAIDEAPDLRRVVSVGGPGRAGVLGGEGFRAAGEAVDPAVVDAARPAVAVRDVGMMFYTSGTTSSPKGCRLTHEALVRVGAMTARRFRYRDGDVMFDPLPMFHTASTQPMLATMWVRGTFVSMVFPDPAIGLDLVVDEGVTVMFTGFPNITEGLLNDPRYDPDTTFRDVRSVFNVAPPGAQESIQARLPHSVLVNAFGMTETAGSATMVEPDEDDEARLHTQGRPLPGVHVEIRDPHNEPLPPGEMGEVVLRGPTLFSGYHRAPDKNAETIEADGTWHSGDLGVLRPDGRLVFKGRLKDMLKVGGENVAAIEIESHLQSHPAVNIAQVIGVPDNKYGEVAAAFIEVRPGAEVTEQEILDHCSGAIAGFKVPRHVRFVTEWPMSSTKVQKFKLRELLDE